MVKGITFDSPFSNVEYYGDTHWDQLLVTSHDDRDQHFDQMYRRAAFTYEAVTRGKAYYIEKAGIGQQYRTGYKDDDGSVTVYFSPELPEGVDKQNWLQTNPGESWFSYLRFYGPTEAYFDETYPLENIKRVK